MFDVRKDELLARSDNMEVDLLSCALVKHDKKLVCGMGDGVMGVFDWGDWGDIRDRIVGHPASVESIVKLDDDMICTASSDGMIRQVIRLYYI